MSSPAVKPLARTPLWHWQAKHQARFVDVDGWQLAGSFRGSEEEVAAARAAVGITDLSAFAKLSLRGAGVTALAREGRIAQPRGVASLGSDDPALACRLNPDCLLLLANGTNVAALEKHRHELGQSDRVVASDETSAYAGFALVGPRTEELLRRVTVFDLATLNDESCAETKVAGVHGLLIRPAPLSLQSVRLYVSWDLGEYVWETLFEKGHALGLVPVGLEAWKRLS